MKKILLLFVISFVTFSNMSAQQTKPKVGLGIGNIAPDIKFMSPEGKEIALSSLRGSIVLIDFWASWCMPCRMENPNLVMAYKKYKSTKFKNGAHGFTVYSVSLDRDKGNWVKAIEQDKLEWKHHVSDLQAWSSKPAAMYGVQSIPTNWLINEKGVILAIGLRGGTLEMELEKLVEKEKAPASKSPSGSK